MNKKHLLTALFAVMSMSALADSTPSNSRMTTMDLTATEMAHYMAPAWNLGNTMEGGWSNSDTMYKSLGTWTETSWQGTTTTQEIINYVAAQGFKSVRIPCAWVMGHITDADNLTIDPNWVNRVKEIIDYCLNAGTNVVINDHWDGGWLEYDGFTDGCDVDDLNTKLSKLWTNIATALKDYDERVIFAGLNEPGVGNASPAASGSLIFSQYGTSTDAQMNAFVTRIQKYEQTFINAVRATGGNNAKRILVVQGPKVDASLSCTYFDMSKLTDTATGRLMFEVHYYDPYQFCQMEEDASWGNMQYYWAGSSYNYTSSTHKGTYYDSSITSVFQNLKTTFVDKGYPVIIGEYGAMWRDLSSASGESQDYHNKSVQYWYNLVTKSALQYGLIPFQWDTNSTGNKTMSSINRETLSAANTYIANGITEGTTAGMTAYNTIYTEPSSGSSSTTTTYKIEAEDATYSGSGCSKVSGSDYSGGYAIRMTDGSDDLTFSFNVETAGKYKVVVMAQGVEGSKEVKCSVNGASSTFKTDALEKVEIGTFKLSAGANTIEITPSWTWYDIDYVSLEADNGSVTFDIPSAPVTSGATESAKTLYTFLKNNFGSKTVSGVMTGDLNTSSTDVTAQTDLQAVYTASGKYPALVGFDFLNATGKSVDEAATSGNTWFSDYTNAAVALAKDLWNKGGIPTFTWHWYDPSRSSSSFYYGTGSDQTQFDFTSAMNSDGSWNTSSDNYKYMIQDIDKVADYLLQLQNAGVACIFRPLHEAEGGWFWWGKQGAENYKKLYLLIYNEMVNVKGVKNLVWDYNSEYETADWCPDAQYFDIISTDIYNDAYDYSSNYVAFGKLKSLTSGKRMISLAECGPVPDIDNEADDGAMWAHWMVWYDSWSGNFVSGKTTTTEWAKVMTDSRVLTLEDMPGWDVSPTVALNTYGYATYSSAVDVNIATSGVDAYKASVDGGKITLTKLDGYIPAGTGVILYGNGMAGTTVTFTSASGSAAGVSDNDLKATTTSTVALVSKPTTGYTFALSKSDNLFHPYNGSAFIANRAFFNLSYDPTANMSGAKCMYMEFADETIATGVKVINNGKCDVNNVVYNTLGQRVRSNAKGLVIKNGRKYFNN